MPPTGPSIAHGSLGTDADGLPFSSQSPSSIQNAHVGGGFPKFSGMRLRRFLTASAAMNPPALGRGRIEISPRHSESFALSALAAAEAGDPSVRGDGPVASGAVTGF